MKIQDFELTEYDEVEEDNVKIFHHVKVDFDNSHTYLNHTPYERVSVKAFRGYIKFYDEHNRFPRFGELNGGNCTNNLMEAYLDV